MKIQSIKLINDGLGGLTVTYQKTETRNGRDFNADLKETKRYPIHTELEETFGWLKNDLLTLCNYTSNKEEREALLESVKMTGVTYSSNGFILSGVMTTIEDLVFPLNTPLIKEGTGYQNYAAVTKILDAIYTETQEYMGGNKVMSDSEYVLKVNKDNKEFDSKTFLSLPADEQASIVDQYMAKNKCIVIPMNIVEEETEYTTGLIPAINQLANSNPDDLPIIDSGLTLQDVADIVGVPAEMVSGKKESKVIPINEVATPKVKAKEVDGDLIVDIAEPVKRGRAAK